MNDPKNDCSKEDTTVMKFQQQSDDQTNGKKTKTDMVRDLVIGFLTDPIQDKTLSKPAEKLRQHAENLRQQEVEISEDEAIQVLLNE